PLLDAVARAALHRRVRLPPPAGPAARRALADGARRGSVCLGVRDLSGGSVGPRLRLLRGLIPGADLGLPRARLRAAGCGAPRDAAVVPGAAGVGPHPPPSLDRPARGAGGAGDDA